MRGILRFTAALFLAACVIQTAGAVTIDYTLDPLGGDRWQYNYTISSADSYNNDAFFQIYFDLGSYENLALESAPDAVDWYTDILQPDPFGGWTGRESDGALLAMSWTLEGFGQFSVSFDWSGLDAPGSQYFELIDFNDFVTVLDSGYTTLRGGDTPPPDVPEPQTFMLLGTGILGLAAYCRRKQARNQ